MKTCLRETDEAIWESPFQLPPPPPFFWGGGGGGGVGVRKLWNLKKIKVKNNQGPLPPK